MPDGYAELLTEIKERIGRECVRVLLAANRALVLLYWDIGRSILARQTREGWGAGTIDRLAFDLRAAFPDMRGFSPRNLKYMRAFAAAWRDREIVQQVVAQIPWGHNIVLLDKVGKEASGCGTRSRRARRLEPQRARPPDWEQGARTRGDGPTIGLLLCKGKDRLIVEYALRDLAKPVGVADWETRLTESLPDGLKGSLPTIEEIEATMVLKEQPS